MSTIRAFTMPKWGIEMTEGTLAEWNIKEGEHVSKGQVIAQIETDKIVNEVQSEFDTSFVRLLAKEGEIYPVGALLGVMASESVSDAAIDEFVRSFRGAPGASTPGASTPAASAPAAEPASEVPAARVTNGAHGPNGASAAGGVSTAGEAAAAGGASGAGRTGVAGRVGAARDLAISVAAKRLAETLKIDVLQLAGSGRHGRITYQDVEQAAKPARTVGGGTAVSIEVKTAALDRHYASPYAKRLALEHGIDLSSVSASSPKGRISRQDVAKAAGLSADALTSRPAYDSIRMSPTRKAIARQLSLSKSTIPHFYLRTQVNLDALAALRAEKKRVTSHVPSLNDYFIRASALALVRIPDVNVQVHGDEIRRFRHADIAVAVAAERGLITPIIRAADTKSVEALSREMRSLIERANSGKLRSEDIEGGSFTVSNLGMFGLDQFDAIINPPQGAILAIGAAARRPIERGGGLSVALTAQVSLSCDHRAIDGAVGARFLEALRALLEAPQGL